MHKEGGLARSLKRNGSLLHVLAYYGASTALAAIVDRAVTRQPAARVAQSSSVDMVAESRVARTLLQGMRTPDQLGRTPLHYLAMGYGASALHERWMREVHRLSITANEAWISQEHFIENLGKDAFGFRSEIGWARAPHPKVVIPSRRQADLTPQR